MVVRMRHNRGQTGSRRSHHKLTAPRLSKDQDGVVHLRHRMTPSTGKYRGRVVVDIAAKKATKIARKKAKAEQK
ncbi:MAG: 50S ribosomal protein L32 [Minisyncoccia bacterium]